MKAWRVSFVATSFAVLALCVFSAAARGGGTRTQILVPKPDVGAIPPSSVFRQFVPAPFSAATPAELAALSRRLRDIKPTTDNGTFLFPLLDYENGGLRQYIVVAVGGNAAPTVVWEFTEEEWRKNAAGEDIIAQWSICTTSDGRVSYVRHRALVEKGGRVMSSTPLPAGDAEVKAIVQNLIGSVLRPSGAGK